MPVSIQPLAELTQGASISSLIRRKSCISSKTRPSFRKKSSLATIPQRIDVFALKATLAQFKTACKVANPRPKLNDLKAIASKHWNGLVVRKQQETLKAVDTPQPPKSAPLKQFNNRSCKSLLTSDGCGGVYLLSDNHQGDTIAVFKPRDEEYMAPKNPRGYVMEGAKVGITEHPLQRGFKIGNGALMERAAYVLDEKYDRFSGVPNTDLVQLEINGVTKEGSLQDFVSSDCSAEDMGSGKFDAEEVHKIGILDIRLFNTDRHSGNILLSKRENLTGTYAMTPIDHGFCLPSFENLEAACFDWNRWPQARFPFCDEALEHIRSLDVESDAESLRELDIDEDSITTMRLCTNLLKIGASYGRSLSAIANIVIREGDSLKSPFEQALESVIQQLPSASTYPSRRAYCDALVKLMTTHSTRLINQRPKQKVRSVSSIM